jgi:hypothetical protein
MFDRTSGRQLVGRETGKSARFFGSGGSVAV